MTRSEWLDIFSWICERWPKASLTDRAAAAWWIVLQDLDADQVAHAVVTISTESVWPPDPSEIRQHIETAQQPDWHELWPWVHQACRGSHGRVRASPEAPDIVRQFVATMSEWRDQVDEGHGALRAQFRDFCNGQQQQQTRQQHQQIADNVLAQIQDSSIGQLTEAPVWQS